MTVMHGSLGEDIVSYLHFEFFCYFTPVFGMMNPELEDVVPAEQRSMLAVTFQYPL